MNLKPIGHRIIVQPDEQQNRTDSGLILIENRDHVATSGTVVALGPGGSLVKYQARQKGIKDAIDILRDCEIEWNYPASLQVARENVARLLGTTDLERDIAVGDRVTFPDDVGHRMVVEGTDYLVLNEDDVAVLVAEDSEAAA